MLNTYERAIDVEQRFAVEVEADEASLAWTPFTQDLELLTGIDNNLSVLLAEYCREFLCKNC